MSSPHPLCPLPDDSPLARARAGIDLCVHCGFCLQSCPTYTTLEDENDSPRGRIVLMRALVEGTLPVDDTGVRKHIDQCLGCRACETACPSGVPYGQLLEATRATLTEERPAPLVARLVLAVFARPRLLALALAGARALRATRIPALLSRLPGRMGFSMAMLAQSTPTFPPRHYTPRPMVPPRGRAAVLHGCVMEGLYTETNRATERTLVVNGWELVDATGEVCCGALHAHAGDLETARALARKNIAAFERSGCDVVAVNSAGCGAMMKEYGHLLADDPAWAARAASLSAKVRDISELLAAAGPVSMGSLDVRVTYDAPCHLLHAQRIATPPLRLLESIRGLTLVPLVDSDRCCGAAGIYNLIEPDVSNAVLEPKLGHIRDTDTAFVATGNPGCLMQIGAGLRREGVRTRSVHPVVLLDESYAKAAEEKER